MAAMRKIRAFLRRFRPSYITSLCFILGVGLFMLSSKLGKDSNHEGDIIIRRYVAAGIYHEKSSIRDSMNQLDTDQHVGQQRDSEREVQYSNVQYKGGTVSKDSTNHEPRLVTSHYQVQTPIDISNNVDIHQPLPVLKNSDTIVSSLMSDNVPNNKRETVDIATGVLTTSRNAHIVRALIPRIASVRTNSSSDKFLSSLSLTMTFSDDPNLGKVDKPRLMALLQSVSSGTGNRANSGTTTSALLPGVKSSGQHADKMHSRIPDVNFSQISTSTSDAHVNGSPERQASWHLSSLVDNKSQSRSQEVREKFSFSPLVRGIYWQDQVDELLPKGIPDSVADQWIAKSRKMAITTLQPPSWDHCGRPKNAFAVFVDGSKMCARYRAPDDRLLQGEIMSYWLARLLGLDSVPPVTLSSVNSQQWSTQWTRFAELGWSQGDYVALSMWIDEMDSETQSPVLIPQQILSAYRSGVPICGQTLVLHEHVQDDKAKRDSSGNSNSSGTMANYISVQDGGNADVKSLVSIVQWGNMIILDYLTANYDRVASMQDGAEKENIASILEESIRNVRLSKNGDKLWFIDNESGLFDAYDLLYLSQENGKRFIHFHDQMLQTMCIFQKDLARRLQELHKIKKPHEALEKYAMIREPLLKYIEKDSSYILFKKHFTERLDKVVKWLSYCENMCAAKY